MKDELNHPFISIASVVTGWIKGPPPGLDNDINDSTNQLKHQFETMSLPNFKVTELPHVELPSFDFILSVFQNLTNCM